MRQCSATIDARHPMRSERVRGFQPPWRTVFVYKCSACGATHRMRASSFRGTRPEPAVGAFVCGAVVAE
jgi:hypothetical protein